jgi:hypothetical protein
VGVWGGKEVGTGVVVGVGMGVETGGVVVLGSGFFGSGTGIGNGDSLGVGVGVVVGMGTGVAAGIGVGVGDGLGIGCVKPGEVILCANAFGGAATDRKLMETVATIGTKNNTKSVKIREESKLNLGIW